MVAGEVLSGVASFFGLGYMLYTAVQMVRSGRGLETYHTSGSLSSTGSVS